MKKAIITLAIMILSCGFSVAQQYDFFARNDSESSMDGFFKSTYAEYRESDSEWGVMPLLPRTHGYHYDYDAEEAPIGSGWLLLAGMGIGYAALKRRKENEQ